MRSSVASSGASVFVGADTGLNVALDMRSAFAGAPGGSAVAVGPAAGGLVSTAGTEANESGQLAIGSASGMVEGSGSPSLRVEDGGQAGIQRTVGGSGC